MKPSLALLAGTALCAAAPATADVNIYTTRQPELVQPVMDAFTEATGIAVNLAFVDGGIVERLRAEGARSPADLVMTVDIANLRQIVEADVIQPVESAVLTAAVPAELRSPDNLWFALTERARIVYASKDRVAEGEVTTYEDLASDTWDGRICTRSGVHNYNLALLGAMVAHHGEDYAREWAAGVRENLARKPEGNDRAQVRAIWAGECDISLGNTYYMGQMLEDPEQTEWANSVRIVFPTFENGGTHVNVSGIAMTKAAPNRDEALQLMEFLVSPEAQEIYAQENYEYPVLEEAEVSDIVAGWGSFEPDTADLAEIADQRGVALRIMEEVNFDG
ncbi:Fe(3+) ABC transporter substrate-binding protein [Ponticoccus sp. SC2-23]|uniref:Fe(3+) ABC transporter substrate-binding protein n=1 Tax=Alexandriicola marinus TaxID=2081710 RepID=UPI000FDCB3D4|nr:Fe(3+) ABC transporter substrate-binding protein [Alexandriicola marinus]MBM1219108.1 Fe(3+) ABC transporter substrate-binding protein [Ponticoccus sp. SC6-9]MBM1223820.1 Fe(3+) ABC transporter substrate-binding protein [Ponticoccus sp. SC6-15]MBM1228922.1 Fe(3+) ABC transporter substrate-binding protein [Ponticoccus sp. SC6-38]MBM1232786.1 Fe(3+) ABC transporter substrate-binding protein [Ponticoccus sp. SC6-45]MBM1237264.1 Fe(3+) ABC transporter substrate-binding protein [Ponticoccus sp. 